MPANYRSNIPRLVDALRRARADALIAATQVHINGFKRALAGGYTSGDFVSGNTLNHVTRTDPQDIGDEMRIAVGTNLMYNLYWELGHINLFLRRFVRVEIWLPTFLQNATRAARVYAAYLKNAIGRTELPLRNVKQLKGKK